MIRIGMLTSGGDCQALNAAMRGVVKTLVNSGEKATVASPVPAAHTPMASPQCERNQRRIKIDAGTIEPKA